MSRTDKDVPYWVRLNNEGTLTDHDHLRLGKPIKKRFWLFDENDQPLTEIVPVYTSANNIVEPLSLYGHRSLPFYWYGTEVNRQFYKNETGNYTEPIFREAHRLVNAGRGNEGVQVGEIQRQRYEDRVIGYVEDHCTEGEKIASREAWSYRYGTQPCTPALAEGHKWWYYGPTSARRSEHERYYSQQRTAARSHFQNLAKAWNAGDDLEDWDEDLVLDRETSTYMYW